MDSDNEFIDSQSNIYTVRIDKSAKDNWDMIDKADQNDLWFHLESFPSPHVTVNSSLT